MTLAVLQFENTTFDIVDRAGEPWLRLHQIGVALGYSRADSVNKLYQSSSDEFTEQMTALVTLPSAGGLQETRIFSLRGCHLLAMLAKTEKAKAFRRWVLDILDGMTGEQNATSELIGLMRDMVQAQNKTLALVERLTQPRRSTRPPLSKDIPQILQLKLEGLPQAEIARQLKLSTAAVSLIVNGRYQVNDDSSVSLGAAFSTQA
jgi:prophage antirepressor-like protein